MEPKLELCCKCNNPVRSADQRYCNPCNAKAQAEHKARWKAIQDLLKADSVPHGTQHGTRRSGKK